MTNLEFSTSKPEANSDASVAPGVLVYLTDSAAEKLGELFAQTPHLEKYLNNLYLPDDETELYHLILPEGIYANGWGHVIFRGQAVYEDDAFLKATDEFYMSYSGVVRIEGNSGEVWQNWSYDQSGNPLDR